jgi:hypothetical protein
LQLDNHGYSPEVMRRIVAAGGEAKSFGKAAGLLGLLAEVPITGRHVGHLTEEVGAELAAVRDAQAAAYRRRELPPEVANVPRAVVVETDGGRLLTRTAAQGVGVHAPHWREDKVACLATLQSEAQEEDPHPEVPRCYLDKDHVGKLVPQVQSVRGGEGAGGASGPAAPASEAAAAGQRWQPVRLVRTVVASMRDSTAFGPLVAAEAQRRNFFAAGRGAFVGDGQRYNWDIQEAWFPHFVAINDFVHTLSYVYLAAVAAFGSVEERWAAYVRWVTACWGGRVAEVIKEVEGCLGRLGPSAAEGGPPPSDPRVVLERSLTYLRNNQPRMDYPRYRRLGLPVVSALVESLIKEMNFRVKGSEKSWNDPEGAERILQVRAALLSEDGRLAKYMANRPGNPYRRRVA